MKKQVVNQWVKQRYYDDDQEPGVDSYQGQCDFIEISPDIIYATGLMIRADRKGSRKEYAQVFSDLPAKEMMYYRPDDKPIFGGDRLHVCREGEFYPVEGLFLKRLSE